jgi:pyridoxal phosphate enzyme (YggS family)
VAVSKTQPNSKILEAYSAGQRAFGENKAQELKQKYEDLPKDIEWHMIGHLQTNKVKYIAPFVSLIHSVDSLKLLEEINKQAAKASRTIACLLQVHIADEETKFGFDETEVMELLSNESFITFNHIRVEGLMGMATFSDDENKVRNEFKKLKTIFDHLQKSPLPKQIEMKNLSMGMSSDYKIAIQEGSTLIRVGSSIFGERN